MAKASSLEFANRNELPELPSSRVRAPAGSAAHCVLVVEDSNAIAALLCASIDALEGIKAVRAASMAEAAHLIDTNAERFFLSVLDLNLPDAPDGEVVDLVKGYKIPIIVLSGASRRTAGPESLEHGIVDYVDKRQMVGVEYLVKLVDRIHVSRDIRILVVDDAAAFRGFVVKLLQNRGYQTCEAVNGREALAVLDANPDVRLIVTDYNMPVLDGLAMIGEIRLKSGREHLAIIGISDNGNPDLSVRFLKSGASDFLVKPFQVEEFHCRVDQNLDMLRLVREARDAADRDFLTKVFNRRYFFKHAAVYHQRALAGDYRILVAMLDVDRFKRLNDDYGHQFGDCALKALAGALADHTAGKALIARFGGEEFVCLRLMSPGEQALEIMQTLCLAVANLELEHEDTAVALSVSIGVTENLDGGLEQTLARADQALYQAKERGRNCVVLI